MYTHDTEYHDTPVYMPDTCAHLTGQRHAQHYALLYIIQHVLVSQCYTLSFFFMGYQELPGTCYDIVDCQ